MPELPEVETIARTLSPQVVGRRITAVHVLLPKALSAGSSLLPKLFPAKVLAVRRRAKLLLVDMAAPDAVKATHLMAFHLKMTGRLFVHPASATPHKHTRLIFDIAPENDQAASRLFFDDIRTFGYCRIMRPEDLEHWPFWQTLGPEPLTLSPEDFSLAIGKRRGAIKALLLNQTILAGVGNIYADEACFRSGIHPATPGVLLQEEQRAMLCMTMKEVLEESIRECGSSIRDYRDANGNAGAFQNLFRVYGRAGQACMVCGTKLKKIVLAARTTVFCPRCQQRPKGIAP